jgi:hypothetical protein
MRTYSRTRRQRSHARNQERTLKDFLTDAVFVRAGEGSIQLGDSDPVHVAVMFDVQGHGPHEGVIYVDQNRYHATGDTALQAADEILEDRLRERSAEHLRELEEEYGDEADAVFRERFDGRTWELSAEEAARNIEGTDAAKFVDIYPAEDDGYESNDEDSREYSDHEVYLSVGPHSVQVVVAGPDSRVIQSVESELKDVATDAGAVVDDTNPIGVRLPHRDWSYMGFEAQDEPEYLKEVETALRSAAEAHSWVVRVVDKRFAPNDRYSPFAEHDVEEEECERGCKCPKHRREHSPNAMMSMKQARAEQARARRFWSSLSREDRNELGDQLVLGTFDYTDWFEGKRPSSAFLNELDRERMHWES